MKLTLLSRPDCHLCLVAERALRDIGADYVVIDVDSDDALREQYGELIPVVLHGEREIARAPITRDGLRAALRGVKLE